MSAEDTPFTMTTHNHSTADAQVIADFAIESASPDELDPNEIYTQTVPAGARRETIDLEQFLDAPRRAKGTVRLQTVDDLVRYVTRHDEPTSTTLWLDIDSHLVVAVLNDHLAGSPAWGDHRATLQLKPTDEWTHWISKDGQLLAQAAFAEHIDDGLREIVTPDPADMLEIAQSIQGATKVEFQSAARLQNGQIGVKWVEEQTAKAGQRGELEIPERFELAIAPFLGEEPYRVGARLRYRLNGGQLALGYKLDRPADVVRDAVDQIAQRLHAAFSDDRVFVGKPRD